MSKSYQLALSIVKKLHEEGHIAYFAGGWVRDFVLKLPSDDIDIATSASPENVQKIFPKTIPVGIAFGIILVVIENHSFEVATFRKEAHYLDARRPSYIEFTTPIEDAKRRDFTINGMFYDPLKNEILDYVEGQQDIEKKIIRAIGNPHERIAEDRLRMIRAVRFSSRFNFTIEKETSKAILFHQKEMFPAVAIERIAQEFEKMASYPGFSKALINLFELGLLQEIFPEYQARSLSYLKKNLIHLETFPKNVPMAIKLLELFPHYHSLEEKINLARHFKLSNEVMDFITFYHHSQILFKSSHLDNLTWAVFLSHQWSDPVLSILLIKMDPSERKLFEQMIQTKKQKLSLAIERIQKKSPFITADHLFKEGLQPGKNFGDLLRLAEKINVNEEIEDEQLIISRLKSSILWPKNEQLES